MGFVFTPVLKTVAVLLSLYSSKQKNLFAECSRVALSSTLKHQFWTLGSSVKLDTTIDSGSEFEWYKKAGYNAAHWKQKAEPKKVKNVKGEKEFQDVLNFLANWEEYKQMGSRQQRAAQAGIIICHIVSIDSNSQVY